MKTFLQPGDCLDIAMPYDRLSGQCVLLGGIFGVCQGDALSGVTQTIKRSGVVTGAKTSAQAWATVGLAIYWDNSAKEFTTTATSNWFIGWNTAVAANPSATGTVVLANVSKAAG